MSYRKKDKMSYRKKDKIKKYSIKKKKRSIKKKSHKQKQKGGNDYYREIVIENIEKEIDERKGNELLHMKEDETHPIDKTRVKNWIEFQPTKVQKTLAKYIINNTTYISWKEFYENCIIIFEKLHEKVVGKTYCIFFPNKMNDSDIENKSNYWMTLLLYDYFKNKGYNLPSKIIILYKNKNNYKFTEEEYIFDYYIAIDDCSYSGSQMFDEYMKIINIKSQSIIILLPYLSNIAFKQYSDLKSDKENKVDLINSVIISNIYDEGKYPPIKISNKIIEFCDGYDEEKIKMLSIWEEKGFEEMKKQQNELEKKWFEEYDKYDETELNLSNKKDLDRFMLLVNTYFPSLIWSYKKDNLLCYFDHKIADYLSSFSSIYQLGIITGFKFDEKYLNHPHNNSKIKMNSKNKLNSLMSDGKIKNVYYPFLKNCYNPQIIGENISNKNLKETIEKLCVRPFYKIKK